MTKRTKTILIIFGSAVVVGGSVATFMFLKNKKQDQADAETKASQGARPKGTGPNNSGATRGRDSDPFAWRANAMRVVSGRG